MLESLVVTLAAKLRLKKLLWPYIGDPEFIQKITRKQKRRHNIPSARLVRGLIVTKQSVDGYDCIQICPQSISSSKVIMYIHGGAFVLPINQLHWRMITGLVRQTGQTVIVPLYPFVPEHNFRDIHARIIDAYQAIIKTTDPADVSVIGDSAGGNLVLALIQLVEKVVHPGVVIALSPVVDLRASNPEIDKLEPYDPLLPLDAIRHLLPEYYSGTTAEDPVVSPLFADFTQFGGNLYILNGGKDLLSPDIELFHQELLSQGIKHSYIYEKNMPHAWPIFQFASSKRTRKKIAKWCSLAEPADS